MKTQTAVPFTDTNIIPDRNAGIGSLLLDLQHPQDPDLDGPPLLNQAFAFIDVGVSRAGVSAALKLLLARDLNMDVDYLATERPDALPYANVTPSGDQAEMIRKCLSGMISSGETKREVTDWHYVVDGKGKVFSVAYAYHLYGNEVWEAYFMGRPFLVSGEKIDFHNPTLDEMLAPDVQKIEAGMDLDIKLDTAPTWEGYRVEKNPLEAGLAAFGIRLQKTDVPERIKDRQNVLFLGNVLNHFPREEQAKALDRIAANMQEGDIVIVQVDDLEASFIEILQVKGHGAQKTLERVRWINTLAKVEVRTPDRDPASWRQIYWKPALERISGRLTDCLERKLDSPEWRQKNHKTFVLQYLHYFLGTFFRALPVEKTLRIAIREALRRLPSEAGPKGIPVFMGDVKDAYGGMLGSDSSPIVSDEDFTDMLMTSANAGGTMADNAPSR